MGRSGDTRLEIADVEASSTLLSVVFSPATADVWLATCHAAQCQINLMLTAIAVRLLAVMKLLSTNWPVLRKISMGFALFPSLIRSPHYETCHRGFAVVRGGIDVFPWPHLGFAVKPLKPACFPAGLGPCWRCFAKTSQSQAMRKFCPNIVKVC